MVARKVGLALLALALVHVIAAVGSASVNNSASVNSAEPDFRQYWVDEVADSGDMVLPECIVISHKAVKVESHCGDLKPRRLEVRKIIFNENSWFCGKVIQGATWSDGAFAGWYDSFSERKTPQARKAICLCCGCESNCLQGWTQSRIAELNVRGNSAAGLYWLHQRDPFHAYPATLSHFHGLLSEFDAVLSRYQLSPRHREKYDGSQKGEKLQTESPLFKTIGLIAIGLVLIYRCLWNLKFRMDSNWLDGLGLLVGCALFLWAVILLIDWTSPSSSSSSWHVVSSLGNVHEFLHGTRHKVYRKNV